MLADRVLDDDELGQARDLRDEEREGEERVRKDEEPPAARPSRRLSGSSSFAGLRHLVIE